jgi:hypothetical protein
MENPFFDHPANPIAGFICSIVSVIASIIAWINVKDVQVYAAIVSALAATGSAIMGARYFHYATKEKKQSILKNNTPNP